MVQRKVKLVSGEVYHIFSRSIAAYRIFNNENEYHRMYECISFHQVKKMPLRFDRFLTKDKAERVSILKDREKLVQVIAYCLMPTHIHLVLKQLFDDGISIFMSNLLNSYARYFNTKHGRKGPLWESRFRNVHVENDEQLLHLTRYVHLNPVTSFLVARPEEWVFSSYREFISNVDEENKVCCLEGLMDVKSVEYKSFVEDNIDYQRSLAGIKSMILD